MSTLTVNLQDPDDVLFALRLIERVVDTLQMPKNDSERVDAAEIARQIDERVRDTSSGTRTFLRALSGFDGEFTLNDVAAVTGEDISRVRARKMQLGRLEKSLRGHLEIGDFSLLRRRWDGVKNTYSLDPEIRIELARRFGQEDAPDQNPEQA